jgi:DNA-binding MarR family transcriptional regulator
MIIIMITFMTVLPIHRRPAHLARRYNQACQALIATALGRHELSNAEYPALATLAEEPGIDQRQLGETLGIDRNSAGLLAETLEQRGLIRREVHPADRRARRLFLTDEGRRRRDLARPDMLAANARALEPLDARERDIFLGLLERLVAHHEALARPGAGRRPRTAAPLPGELA